MSLMSPSTAILRNCIVFVRALIVLLTFSWGDPKSNNSQNEVKRAVQNCFTRISTKLLYVLNCSVGEIVYMYVKFKAFSNACSYKIMNILYINKCYQSL